MTARPRWIVALLVAGLTAWGVPVAGADQVPDEPAMVLDGTDLVTLEEVNPADLPATLEGSYEVEQGGSVLKLSISEEADQSWTVERSYQEPGVAAEVKTYTTQRRDGELVSGDGDLRVRGSETGLLVLERQSGSTSIPPDYWIHYYPHQ